MPLSVFEKDKIYSNRTKSFLIVNSILAKTVKILQGFYNVMGVKASISKASLKLFESYF